MVGVCIRYSTAEAVSIYSPVYITPQWGWWGFYFMEVEACHDVGLEVLLASGWRPDCVLAERLSILRERPLWVRPEHPNVFGSPHELRWLSSGNIECFEHAMDTA